MPKLVPKRSRSDSQTEPETKRQKHNEEQPLDIVVIDPNGDLIVRSESSRSGYQIDSNALRRASQKLYDQCLAVQPHNGTNSSWIFKGMPDSSRSSRMAILDLMHGNVDQIPESMHFEAVHDAVFIAKEWGIFDRYCASLKQWYQTMAQAKRIKSRECSRLWLAKELGLKEDFIKLQTWTIFNLCENGKGGLGDPHEETSPRQPLDLSKWRLSDNVITDMIVRIRFDAVTLILTRLKEAQLAMISNRPREIRQHPITFRRSRPFSTQLFNIGYGFRTSSCEACWKQWLACLCRVLYQPTLECRVSNSFPSLYPVIEAEGYHGTLNDLCVVVTTAQDRMRWIPRQDEFCKQSKEEDNKCCSPPELVGKKEIERFVNESLKNTLEAN